MIAGGSYIDELNLRTGYELLFFAIHFSLFVCLLWYNRRRKAPFATGFYKLFLLQSCFIYMAFVVVGHYRTWVVPKLRGGHLDVRPTRREGGMGR